ncbi:MAG: hypothetical protein HWN68_20555 [Desulfobacterales bacterium]|nr:hypothetical protein [Desulfobacterales bacterium]
MTTDNLYIITNRITGEQRHICAPSAQEACEKCGWLIGFCHARLLVAGVEAKVGG